MRCMIDPMLINFFGKISGRMVIDLPTPYMLVTAPCLINQKLYLFQLVHWIAPRSQAINNECGDATSLLNCDGGTNAVTVLFLSIE